MSGFARERRVFTPTAEQEARWRNGEYDEGGPGVWEAQCNYCDNIVLVDFIPDNDWEKNGTPEWHAFGHDAGEPLYFVACSRCRRQGYPGSFVERC